MTNREENLKKLNDELEKLSDEELDKVAGGGNFFYTYLDAPANIKAESNANLQGGLEKHTKYGTPVYHSSHQRE